MHLRQPGSAPGQLNQPNDVIVAPDGSIYNIHTRTGSGTDNIIKTVMTVG